MPLQAAGKTLTEHKHVHVAFQTAINGTEAMLRKMIGNYTSCNYSGSFRWIFAQQPQKKMHLAPNHIFVSKHKSTPQNGGYKAPVFSTLLH